MLSVEKQPAGFIAIVSPTRLATSQLSLNKRTNGAMDFPSHGSLRCRPRNEKKKPEAVVGNYLDEVWTLDKRSGGITVADLNENAVSVSTDRHFYHSNTLYSVYGLTDEAGNVVESYMYDSYGRQTVITDGLDADAIVNFNANDVHTLGGSSLVGNPWMYTGQRLDAETSLMYYKNRYYSVDLGRFVSRWVDQKLDVSFYQYQFSKPTKFTDPLGDPDPVLPDLGKDIINVIKRETATTSEFGNYSKAVIKSAKAAAASNKAVTAKPVMPECADYSCKGGYLAKKPINKVGVAGWPVPRNPVVGGDGTVVAEIHCQCLTVNIRWCVTKCGKACYFIELVASGKIKGPQAKGAIMGKSAKIAKDACDKACSATVK